MPFNLNDLATMTNAANNINTNSQLVEDEINDNLLKRNNPRGDSNVMEVELDMNSNAVNNASSVSTASLTIGGDTAITSRAELKGDKGDTGDTGPAGADGADGADGVDGAGGFSDEGNVWTSVSGTGDAVARGVDVTDDLKPGFYVVTLANNATLGFYIPTLWQNASRLHLCSMPASNNQTTTAQLDTYRFYLFYQGSPAATELRCEKFSARLATDEVVITTINIKSLSRVG